MTTQLKALHHLSFTVPDLDAALSFWRDLLGFQPMARPEMGFAGAWLSGFGTEVHLLAPTTGAEPADGRLSPLRNHVAFRVDDLAAMREKLEAAGLEVMGGRGAIRQMWVLDPGANVIEFIQPA
jgi:catechol 2,3-dioxygenase-like lactoylglutathione lyase family enzyme